MFVEQQSESVVTPEFKQKLGSLFVYLKKVLPIKSIPKVKLVYNIKNSKDILGKTGNYDHKTDTIHLYVIGRHPKDVLRSFAHEVVHKSQHDNNLFNIRNEHDTSPGYAQRNKNLRMAESDAYQRGSLTFRDWEDFLKK